jgi:hypothetical protein
VRARVSKERKERESRKDRKTERKRNWELQERER